MIKAIIVFLFFAFTSLFSGVIGNGYAVVMHGIYQNNFRTLEACEAYLRVFYKDQSYVKCVRIR